MDDQEDATGFKTTECSSDPLAVARKPIERGTSLGRYIIIEPIGAGAMGVVYRAFDPELNRSVALKLVSVKKRKPESAQRAKDRLIREAQALARVSHPHVVAVHDVGYFEDDVFIAMELVPGQTLNFWLKTENQSVVRILETMIAAGRGLWAAHCSGLVHRDFKPSNIIIGDDARVRVLDFGLARAAGDWTEEDQECPPVAPIDLDQGSSTSDRLHSRLTSPGGIVGTPLYMSPEQHMGQMADERSDQFSFCVVLYEALYQQRPFAANNRRQLYRKVMQHKISPTPKDSPVPAWMAQIILKGLRVDPAERHPSMEALLDKLQRNPQAGRRQRWLMAAGGFILLAMLGLWSLLSSEPALCKHAHQKFVGLWDLQSKALAQQAILRTGLDYAQETWSRVETVLDSYTGRWIRAHTQACEATHILGEQSQDLLDLRMVCLMRGYEELKTLSTLFQSADAKIVQHAITSIDRLSSLEQCADTQALLAYGMRVNQPQTAIQKQQVQTIRADLAAVKVLIVTGKYQQALKRIRQAVQAADASGYPPLVAESGVLFGNVLVRTGDFQDARATLEKAWMMAETTGQDEVKARCSNSLIWVLGYHLGQEQEALLEGQRAQATIVRLENRPEFLSTWHSRMAALYFRLGDLARSAQHDRSALEILLGFKDENSVDVASAYNNLGVTALREKHHKKARHYFQRVLAIVHKTIGLQHPDSTNVLTNLGLVCLAQNDHTEASLYFNQSLRLAENSLGVKHPMVAWPLMGLGKVFMHKQEFEAARSLLGRAEEVCEKRGCPIDLLAEVHFQLALALHQLGLEPKRSKTLAQKAHQGFAKIPYFDAERKKAKAFLAALGQ